MASLAQAARLATLLRRDAEEPVRFQYKHITQFAEKNTSDDVAEVAEFFYGHRVMGVDRLMATVSRCVGIFGEEWDGLLDSVVTGGHALVPLLASESQLRPKHGLSLSISEATLLLYDLQKRDEAPRVVDTIFRRIGREEATMLWSRALGEYPPVGKGKFIRAVSNMTEYEPNHLRQAARFHGIAAVVKGALDDSLPRAHQLVAGQPFTPAAYRRWVKWVPPFEQTAYDVVEGARAFVHVTPDGTWVFRRSGERWSPCPPIDGLQACEEFVAEVEERHGRLVVVDILHTSDEPQRWKQPVTERRPDIRLLRDRDHLISLIKNLQRGTSLRLLDSRSPYYDGEGMGGYIAPDSLFEITLLVTRARLIDGQAEVCLSMMDGFDAQHVACVRCDTELIRVPRLRKEITTRWSEIEHLGVVVVCFAFGYDGETLDGVSVQRIDGSLGVSDTIQKGDLLAMSNAR